MLSTIDERLTVMFLFLRHDAATVDDQREQHADNEGGTAKNGRQQRDSV